METGTEVSKDGLIKRLRWSIRLGTNYKRCYIYEVGHDAIAKRNKHEQSIRPEYNMGVSAYENRAQVPKIHCLVEPDPDGLVSRLKHLGGSITKDYMIMQKIKGRHIPQLLKIEMREAIRQYRYEIEKLLDLGIVPHDSDWVENSIFSDEGRLYLFDFEEWKKGTPEEIDKAYKKIKSPVTVLRDRAPDRTIYYLFN